MAMRPLVSRQNLPCYSPSSFVCCQKSNFHLEEMPNISRRVAIATVALGAKDAILKSGSAYSWELKLVAPDTTLEMAESGIREHAESLLGIKPLLESECWPEAQKLLRKSSSNLKLDLYTIIQNKPGNERPLLRKLYFDLFSNVTKLDYAARDKDASRVWQCYGNITAALDDIFGRI